MFLLFKDGKNNVNTVHTGYPGIGKHKLKTGTIQGS
jgi:hypothetical protein